MRRVYPIRPSVALVIDGLVVSNRHKRAPAMWKVVHFSSASGGHASFGRLSVLQFVTEQFCCSHCISLAPPPPPPSLTDTRTDTDTATHRQRSWILNWNVDEHNLLSLFEK